CSRTASTSFLFQALIQFVANAFASIRFMQAPMSITRATYRDRMGRTGKRHVHFVALLPVFPRD
ncbi:MAG: hypothetical protein WB036_27390, partial [Pseudolabrys sp.]